MLGLIFAVFSKWRLKNLWSGVVASDCDFFFVVSLSI